MGTSTRQAIRRSTLGALGNVGFAYGLGMYDGMSPKVDIHMLDGTNGIKIKSLKGGAVAQIAVTRLWRTAGFKTFQVADWIKSDF